MKRDDRNLSIGARIKFALLAALFGLAAFLATACGGSRAGAVPGNGAAPGTVERSDDAEFVEAETPGYAPADAEFVRDMIVHHQQALHMTALAPDRTDSDDMRLLAKRIEETQEFEIDLMLRWLEERGEPVPEHADAADAHGGGHEGHARHAGMAEMSGMAGMASPEQMAALADSEGEAFDRMFLELMIRHHEGALIMVDDLLETERGGKEPQLFMMISHIDVDQRAEIARMQGMLDQLNQTGGSG
ncbi:MAG TPA: DUF305 domain-containing protein [Gemmatimonadota bacterium]|nr:DUF305 domain-containing protein [Gemmatimonadota bacterium]